MLPELVVFGLGNPGPRYVRTRHNIGYRVVDRLAAGHRAPRWVRRGSYASTVFHFGAAEVLLVKPRTYVNLSGLAARQVQKDFEIEPARLLVVVDDLAIPLGQLRLRRRGSDGGHNGLKSVISELGTTAFPRLRLGVGPIPPETDPVDFVLGSFPASEAEAVDDMVGRAALCVGTILSGGFERAMGEFNAGARGESG